MIRDYQRRPIRTYIISSGRSDTVEAMEAWCSGLEPRWIVTPGEAEAYERHGASVIEQDGALAGARNRAIEEAGDGWCFQVDDDLAGLGWATGNTKADTQPLTLTEAAIRMSGAALDHGCHLAGVAPTANAFYYSGQPVKLNGFCVGDLLMIDPASEPRFDPTFRLKEDYDFTLQHLDRYGAVARVDAILAVFRHRTNPGGAVAYRTDDLEAETIAALTAKWPGRIVPNPRRANEVLLRWPKARHRA